MTPPEDAFIRGVACTRRGDLRGALEAFTLCVRQAPFVAAHHFELARCAAEASLPTLAVRHFRHAIRLAPDAAAGSALEARFQLALLLDTLDQVGAAAVEYRKLLALAPDFLPARNNLAHLALKQGQWQTAETLFRQVLEQSPDLLRAGLGLAWSLESQGRLEAALAVYQQILRAGPHPRHLSFLRQRVSLLSHSTGRRRTGASAALVRLK